MVFDFNNEKFERELIDKDRYFRLVYSPTLDCYFMFCMVCWVAWYERYYFIAQEDYELYKMNKESFYQKFEKEIGQKKDCFTERFVGAAALRDYDGANGFQNAFPLPNGESNSFQHHVYIDGVFYARIVWQDGEIFVPPVQAILKEDGKFYFPLREKCEHQTNVDGQPICYKLKKEHRG